MASATVPAMRSPVFKPGLVDLARQMRSKGILQFYLDVWQEYGDLAHMRLRPREMFLVVHPEHVRYANVIHHQNFDMLQTYDVVRDLLPGHRPRLETTGTLNSQNGMPMIIEGRS